MAKFGFIGMGNMGSAIMRGLLKVCAPSELLFTDASKERREASEFVESSCSCSLIVNSPS